MHRFPTATIQQLDGPIPSKTMGQSFNKSTVITKKLVFTVLSRIPSLPPGDFFVVDNLRLKDQDQISFSIQISQGYSKVYPHLCRVSRSSLSQEKLPSFILKEYSGNKTI